MIQICHLIETRRKECVCVCVRAGVIVFFKCIYKEYDCLKSTNYVDIPITDIDLISSTGRDNLPNK